MKKKITKAILNAIPQRLYTEDGKLVNRQKIADSIFDNIPGIEKLDIEPFQCYIPIVCSNCFFNGSFRLGCTYEFFSDKMHEEHKVPDACPLHHVLGM